MHDKADSDAVEEIRDVVDEIEAEHDLKTAFWSLDAVYDEKDTELWQQKIDE